MARYNYDRLSAQDNSRGFNWLNMSLDRVKAVRRGLACSVNDVVLTVVTGAVREFLMLRGVNPARIDFKISAPVSMRSDEEPRATGRVLAAAGEAEAGTASTSTDAAEPTGWRGFPLANARRADPAGA